MLRFRIPVGVWAASSVIASVVVLVPVVLVGRMGLLSPWMDLRLISVIVALALAISYYAQVLWIDEDGLVLNRSNRLAWCDITDAEVRTFAGLPYLFVRRSRGLPWWLPLYYRGSLDLRYALLRSAPDGHPVRRALA